MSWGDAPHLFAGRCAWNWFGWCGLETTVDVVFVNRKGWIRSGPALKCFALYHGPADPGPASRAERPLRSEVHSEGLQPWPRSSNSLLMNTTSTCALGACGGRRGEERRGALRVVPSYRGPAARRGDLQGEVRDWEGGLDMVPPYGTPPSFAKATEGEPGDRAVNAEKAKLPRGETEEWAKKRARDLGRSVRTIHLYRYLAEGLGDPRIVMSLQKSHADKGLAGVLAAIRKERRKQSGAEPPQAGDKVAAWRVRATRLLEGLPQVRNRAELLREHMMAVREALQRELEGAGPGEPR